MENFDLRKYLAENRLLKETKEENYYNLLMDLGGTELAGHTFQDMMKKRNDFDSFEDFLNDELDFFQEEGNIEIIDKIKSTFLNENKLLKEEISLDAFLKNQLTGIEGKTEGMETVEREEWLDMFGGTKNESGFDDIYNLIKKGKNSHSIDFGDFKANYALKIGDDKIIIKYKVKKDLAENKFMAGDGTPITQEEYFIDQINFHTPPGWEVEVDGPFNKTIEADEYLSGDYTEGSIFNFKSAQNVLSKGPVSYDSDGDTAVFTLEPNGDIKYTLS